MNNPIRFIDPDGMEVGDYIKRNGEVIGNDGKKDQNVHLVTDKSSIETIKTNEKAGEKTDLTTVTVDVTTTQTELTESLDVLKRTDANGGLREETSVVTPEGEVTRGKTGNYSDGKVTKATLPAVPGNDNTSIHSHRTGVTATGGDNALNPGPDDPTTFEGFKLNIIVGPFGDPYYDAQTGMDIPRVKGAAFFGRYIPSKGAKPLGTLPKRSIEKALKKLK
jgi:hypothetical protein